MFLIFGTTLIVLSLLLFTYYRKNAKEDKYNRPSFFNSKLRIYLLFLLILLFFISGEFLFIVDEYYNWIWFVPLLYFIIFSSIRSKLREDMMIKKLFHYYLVFSNQNAIKSKDDRLLAPIGFMLALSGFPKKFQDEANDYLIKRVKTGIIKGPKDLPHEAWTIIQSFGKDKIEEDPEFRISEKKIDYFYQECIEGKKHNDIGKILSNQYQEKLFIFDTLFKTFSFICPARPDFSREEVQLIDANILRKGRNNESKTTTIAVFQNIHANVANKFGWVDNLDEYTILAALEFQRRYPVHKFSKKVKKQHNYSNKEIFNYAKYWEKLDVDNIKIFPE